MFQPSAVTRPESLEHAVLRQRHDAERPRRFQPTLTAVWATLAVALPARLVLAGSVGQNDFWWSAATGRLILTGGEIPTADAWSFTQYGEKFVNQAWLAHVALYGIVRAGGPELALAVASAVIAITYGLLFFACSRQTKSARLASLSVLGFAVPVGMAAWTVRAQLFALPLFAYTLFVLWEYRRTGGVGWPAWGVWTLPAVILLWANLHGSFAVGLMLLWLVVAAEVGKYFLRRSPVLSPGALRVLTGVGLASVAATLVNPEGWGLYRYVRELAGHDGVRGLINEWAPVSVNDWWGIAFFVGVGVLVVVLIYGRRRPDPTDLVVLAAFAVLTLRAVRGDIWFSMVGAVVLATHLRGSVLDRPMLQGVPWVNAAVIGSAAIVLALSLPWAREPLVAGGSRVLAADTPVEAVELIQQADARPSRLFHDFAYGSYLTWAAPEQGVFIDPRADLYPHSQLSDYLVLSSGYDIDRLMTKYDIDGALLSVSRQGGLIDQLRAHPDWEVEFEAGDAVYFLPVDR